MTTATSSMIIDSNDMGDAMNEMYTAPVLIASYEVARDNFERVKADPNARYFGHKTNRNSEMRAKLYMLRAARSLTLAFMDLDTAVEMSIIWPINESGIMFTPSHELHHNLMDDAAYTEWKMLHDIISEDHILIHELQHLYESHGKSTAHLFEHFVSS